jgi:hypothetical protein
MGMEGGDVQWRGAHLVTNIDEARIGLEHPFYTHHVARLNQSKEIRLAAHLAMLSRIDQGYPISGRIIPS